MYKVQWHTFWDLPPLTSTFLHSTCSFGSSLFGSVWSPCSGMPSPSRLFPPWNGVWKARSRSPLLLLADCWLCPPLPLAVAHEQAGEGLFRLAPPAATDGFTGVPCYPGLVHMLSRILLSQYVSAFTWRFGEIEKYSKTIIVWEFLTKLLISLSSFSFLFLSLSSILFFFLKQAEQTQHFQIRETNRRVMYW